MTRPGEIMKGMSYRLPGEEFCGWEIITPGGLFKRKPIFKRVVFSEKATYNGRFDLGDGDCRCNACHRRIRRGYQFTDIYEGDLHFGRCCLIRHVSIPEDEMNREGIA